MESASLNSLANVQVVWWFFLVAGSFLLIYLITGEFTMSEQALVLMGIGTGTALGAAMIDANKLSLFPDDCMDGRAGDWVSNRGVQGSGNAGI